MDRISGGGRFVESLLSRALDLQVVRFTQSARILSVVCQELQLSSFVVAQNLCRTAWSRSCLPSGGIYKTDIRRAFAFGDQLAQTCAREGSGLLWRHFRRDWARFNRDKLTGLYGSQTRTGFNRDRLTGLYRAQAYADKFFAQPWNFNDRSTGFAKHFKGDLFEIRLAVGSNLTGRFAHPGTDHVGPITFGPGDQLFRQGQSVQVSLGQVRGVGASLEGLSSRVGYGFTSRR